jgi:hypothetical protein
MTDMGGRDQIPGVSPRDRYLERVAVRLRMPDEASDAVLDELATHIEDAIAAGIRNGLTADEAEREALARLGSPDDLGDELRRTHQTRRRLLAAAGGGVWQGAQGAVRGYLGGVIVSMPLALGGGLVAQIIEVLFGTSLSFSAASRLFELLFFPAIWGAAWLGARYFVEAVSRQSRRATETLRRPIALFGAGLAAIPVVFVPMDHTEISIVLASLTPFVFAAGALTTDLAAAGWVHHEQWPSRLPPLRRIAFVGFVVFVVGSMVGSLVVSAIRGPTQMSGPTSPPAETPRERWISSGFDVVAPTVLDLEGFYLGTGFDRDGRLLVRLPDDRLDWDEWRGLQLEVWAATSARDNEGNQAIVGEAPLGIDPIVDPWAPEDLVVKVGFQGEDGYLVFLTGHDSRTGQRVVIGWPEGGESAFHGSLLEWFGVQ